ncbi:NAD(P)-dependent oxidoreductase [Arenibacterium halophilum]|nr:NAD(P)-dependent oxidoreductase [Arenibacterium halophilum]
MPVILLTDPIDPTEARRLEAVAQVRLLGAEGVGPLAEEMSMADIVIVRRKIPAEDVVGANRLRALIRHGVGLDFIPVETASANGIAVTNTPGTNEQSVAEQVFGMVLGLRRDILRNDTQVRAGAWDGCRARALDRRDLHGATLGLIGFGSIGRAVARIAHFGFGMTVVATKRSQSDGPEWVRLCPLDDVLSTADILVLACPLTPETRSLISREALAKMQPDSILVNIARGPVVDEAALADALRDGVIGGACLDVFTTQPLPPESPLRSAPNTVLSPHVAGVTADSMRRMSQVAVDDALRILSAEQPRHLCNAQAWPEIAKRWATYAT